MALMNSRACCCGRADRRHQPTLINGLIERLKRGATSWHHLFVIEHNMRVVMNLAEHIYCLAHGELLADGRPKRCRTIRACRRLSGGT